MFTVITISNCVSRAVLYNTNSLEGSSIESSWRWELSNFSTELLPDISLGYSIHDMNIIAYVYMLKSYPNAMKSSVSIK
jgi:hypothetical protein